MRHKIDVQGHHALPAAQVRSLSSRSSLAGLTLHRSLVTAGLGHRGGPLAGTSLPHTPTFFRHGLCLGASVLVGISPVHTFGISAPLATLPVVRGSARRIGSRTCQLLVTCLAARAHRLHVHRPHQPLIIGYAARADMLTDCKEKCGKSIQARGQTWQLPVQVLLWCLLVSGCYQMHSSSVWHVGWRVIEACQVQDRLLQLMA